MDFDNQKGLWRHSLSMEKRRKFIPLFKKQDSTEQEDHSMSDHSPTWEESPQDFTKSQENFDDSNFK
eukprot:15368914-Alexandrium_andersonii.AAC.1